MGTILTTNATSTSKVPSPAQENCEEVTREGKIFAEGNRVITYIGKQLLVKFSTK